jgi:hypothetical protein
VHYPSPEHPITAVEVARLARVYPRIAAGEVEHEVLVQMVWALRLADAARVGRDRAGAACIDREQSRRNAAAAAEGEQRRGMRAWFARAGAMAFTAADVAAHPRAESRAEREMKLAARIVAIYEACRRSAPATR